MALGDAIAVALMRAKGFSQIDFAGLHPGGSLGRRLSLVRDHMHGGESFPHTTEDADFHEVLEAVTNDGAFGFGIVAVLSPDGRLLGAISDGDIRRALLKLGSKALEARARELMTKAPKTIADDYLAIDALALMTERRISRLFVTRGEGAEAKPIGLVRLQDLLAAKIV
jgi:arabinose-5-phosphate isomerase